MNKPIIQLILFFLAVSPLTAQDMKQVRQDIQQLTSERQFGRGYVRNGDKRAAEYLKDRFKEIGLKPVDGNYFQKFQLSVNTFSKVKLELNGKELELGREFILKANSGSGKLEVEGLALQKKNIMDQTESIGLLDITALTESEKLEGGNAQLLIDADSILTASIAPTAAVLPRLIVVPQAFPEVLNEVKIEVKGKVKKNYTSQNVLGKLEGSAFPDSIIVVSAHYDHLGGYDKENIFFPGANDNASGISMLLQLATHFSKPENKPEYSMLFIAFGGEEAGLVGSRAFVEFPPLPLGQIAFVQNLDIISTGDKGITIVNGSVFPHHFQLIDSINKVHELLPGIGSRGKAANSDHYFFSEIGIPSFFIYTEGSARTYYHDVRDKADTLPLTKYAEVYRLLTLFLPSLMRG